MNLKFDVRTWTVSALAAALTYAGVSFWSSGGLDIPIFVAFVLSFTLAWAVLSEVLARRNS